MNIDNPYDYGKMSGYLWGFVDHFNQQENWGNSLMIDVPLIYFLDALRKEIQKRIDVYCAYELTGHSETSQHKLGRAVDCASMMDVIDFYFRAVRYPFSGIGIYPFWTPRPGLHLDKKRLGIGQRRRIWWRDEDRVYHNIKTHADFNLMVKSHQGH